MSADDPLDARDDAAARSAVQSDVGATLFVEAGAGSGKTSALVGRIVELVCSGTTRLGEVAAITFTEAAAAELRDRVRDGLTRVAAGDADDRLDPQWTTRTQAEQELRSARAAAALEEVDGAAIATLHAFAQRLLREHPLELGLPPVLTVLDPAASSVDFEDRWDRFLDGLLEDEAHQEAVLRLLACDVRLDDLRAIARSMTENWDLTEDLALHARELGAVDVTTLHAHLRAAVAYSEHCVADDDKLLQHLSGLAGFTSRLTQIDSPLEALEVLRDAPKLSLRGGQKRNWSGVDPQTVRALLADAEQARSDALGLAAYQALAQVLVAMRVWTLQSAADRRAQGRLQFHDLLVGARTLLREHPDAAEAVRRRYRYLLIDEFQDTDPIQAELAVRIAAGPTGSTTANWQDLTPEPGRAFFVGDPKQAIYRFRRADIELFLTVRDRIGGEVLALTRSFRSVPGIVAWVNAVFGDLIGEGDGTRQPAYLPLAPVRAASLDGVTPVKLLGGVHELHADEVRAIEAADIAATITTAVEKRWPVGDEGRAATLSDIALLLPTRAALPQLLDALEAAGIPARVEASSLVYDTDEVRELLSVLRAIDDPTNEVATVAALRGSLFGCGDDDLLRWYRARGTWNYTVPAPSTVPDDDPVALAMAELAGLHEQRSWCDVSVLVDEVLVRRNAYALALDTARPRDVWRRLRFVADQARLYDESVGGDLRGYLRWTDVLSDDNAKVSETVLPETDDDAVRILTIHGAKGLQFPIVMVCGLGTANNNRTSRVLWDRHTPSIEVSLKAAPNPGHVQLAEEERAMAAHEQLRLLYVATTRAEDHLVVSLHHKKKTNCSAATLESVCEAHEALADRIDVAVSLDDAAAADAAVAPADERSQPSQVKPLAQASQASQSVQSSASPRAPTSSNNDDGGAALPGAGGPDERAAWLQARRDLMAAALVPRAVSPSTIAREAAEARRGVSGLATTASEDDRALAKEETDDETQPWRRGRAGTAIGRAVHGTLQLVDLATGEGLAALATSQAEAEQIPEHAPTVERLAAAALATPIVRAAAAGRCWKEVFVAAPVDGRILEGFIDLLVQTDDGFVVVDYKTDQVASTDDIDARLERYRLQGAAYALAVQESLGFDVVRCTFVFLGGDGAIERDLDDLAAAVDDVRAHLLTPSRSVHTQF